MKSVNKACKTGRPIEAEGKLQMRPNCLLSRKVIDVSSRYAQATLLLRSATDAGAIRLDRPEVLGKGRVLEVQHSIRGYGIAEALRWVLAL